MRFEKLAFEDRFDLCLHVPEGTGIKEGTVELSSDASMEGGFNLRQRDTFAAAEVLPQSAAEAAEIFLRLQRNCAHYEVVLNASVSGTIHVEAIFFADPMVTMKDFAVVVPYRLYADTNVHEGGEVNWPEYLRRELTLSDSSGKAAYFLISFGRNQEMTLWGEHLYLKVQRQDSQGMSYLSAMEMKSHTYALPPVIRLAQGCLRILSENESASFQANNAAMQYELLTAQAEQGTYIENWDAYGEIEGDILLDKARKVGVLHFTAAEPAADGGAATRFFLREEPPAILNHLNKKESFCLVPEDALPPYLLEDGEQVNWDLYQEITSDSGHSSKNKEDSFGRNYEGKGTDYIRWIEQHRGWVSTKAVFSKLSFIKYEPERHALVLAGHDDYKTDWALIYDITGSEVNLGRKEKARGYIRNGDKAGMPQLRFLLEGAMDQMNPPPRVPHINSITPFVQKKVFPVHPPTPVQAQAVDIALNTPDIALIQGPPGTGKTTVITAIVERLNEEADRKKSFKGQVLVSAFQHDAVENAVNKLSINAMPTYKFGEKNNSEEKRNANQVFDDWIVKLRDRLEKKYPGLGITQAVILLERVYSAYLRQPGQVQLANLLAELSEVSAGLSSVLQRELFSLKQSYGLTNEKQEMQAGSRERLGIVRSLRVQGGKAMDDDQQRAAEFCEAFKQELTEEETAFLQRFISAEPKEPEYCELRKLKQKYLSLCLERPYYRQPKIDQALDDFCQRALADLKENRSALTRKQEILADYVLNLANDPIGVRDGLIDNACVFSATVQQSDGKEIRLVKGSKRDEPVYFDTVIVDEAARSSPLDLLIPMAGAKRRIVLVGDHKQLPHIVDKEICGRMENGGGAESLDQIRGRFEKSLFQHLFERMQELEKQDHIRRTITLDQQFRMHPVIGEFISHYFYVDRLQSPLPAELFRQQLSGLGGKPVLWLDVPFREGNEERHGTSHIRPVEARAAARLLHRWMGEEAGRDLTFGVISFYRAQNDEIYEALIAEGMAQHAGGPREDGPRDENQKDYRICAPYREDGTGRERLRVGTVDAFQGMEFDVVLLMMVRTRQLPLHIGRQERDYNQIFGFLRSKNRLCVSMSRGKKVLAVIGDKALAQSPEARAGKGMADGPDLGVPELAAFADLCEAQGVVSEWGKGVFADV